MSLVSVTYITNQQSAKLFQLETKAHRNSPKPIFLRHLRTVRGLRRSRRASRGSWFRLTQLKRNELGLVGTTEHRTGEKPPQKNASAAKGDSSSQRYRSHDDAEKNDVDQQIGDVVFLVEVRVLVPGNAGRPVHRTQQSLRVAFGNRARGNCNDWPRALIEEWANVFDRISSGRR